MISVEEAFVTGGLGSLIAEAIAEGGLRSRLVRCGVTPILRRTREQRILAKPKRANGRRPGPAHRRGISPQEDGRVISPAPFLGVASCRRSSPATAMLPASRSMYERLRAVFQKLGVDYEIIFVNDGSPDNAREVLAELAARDPCVVVVNHSRNFGSQAAFTSGMRISTGDAVILLDGDLQDPPELIASIPTAPGWRGTTSSTGVRVRRETSLAMSLTYKLFYRLFRAAAYVRVPLDAGDFSLSTGAFRRAQPDAGERPLSARLRAWVGFRQTGIPLRAAERMFGRTTNSLLRNLGMGTTSDRLFSYLPLDLIAWAGFPHRRRFDPGDCGPGHPADCLSATALPAVSARSSCSSFPGRRANPLDQRHRLVLGPHLRRSEAPADLYRRKYSQPSVSPGCSWRGPALHRGSGLRVERARRPGNCRPLPGFLGRPAHESDRLQDPVPSDDGRPGSGQGSM